MIFQAGDSEEGREFAASSADAIFSRHGTLEAGQAFYADVKGRLARYGRARDELLILPAATFVLGDTDAEAQELAREVRLQQVSGQTAIKFAGAAVEPRPVRLRPGRPAARGRPALGENTIARGRASVRMYRDPLAIAARVAGQLAAAREAVHPRADHRGDRAGRRSSARRPRSPTTIDDLVQADASDGFILVPHITPGGLDEFADTVVPLLQERGVFRTEYEGDTLRDHLGLDPLPAGRASGHNNRAVASWPLAARRAGPGPDQLRVDRGRGPA